MITIEEAMALAYKSQMELDLAKLLAHEAIAFAEICEKRNYKVGPIATKIYVTRIKEVLCASKEQKETVR